MMEKLFALQHQRETFLLLCAGGFALGLVIDLTRIARRMGRMAALAGDVLAALALFALLAYASLRSGEGLRLYGLLGAALGAAVYLAVVSRALQGAWRQMKKLAARLPSGRKSC